MFWIPDQRLWRWFVVNAEWPEMLKRREAFLQRWNAEQAEIAQQKAEAAEKQAAAWAEIEEEAEHMCDMLPLYLHRIGLSYKRSIQDKKDGGFYERVEYCTVLDWEVTEDTYYFWIGTSYPDPLPEKVHIAHFMDEAVKDTLSSNFGSKAWIHYNPEDGLWICVERRAGRGQVPRNVTYQETLREMPKSADPLAFPLGQGVNRRQYILDLDEMIHLLIGGQTGGGKSNMMNVLLTTLIRRNTPETLRLIMADFKRVEFAFYRNIPHLGGDARYLAKTDDDGKKKGIRRTVSADFNAEPTESPLGDKIIIDGQTLIKVSEYVLAEIERRTMLLEGKAKKIGTWNKRYPKKKLSRWIVIIDELADVMLQPSLKRKLEPTLVRIAQLGRAVGIHLILATQTPKTDVITQLIQNNIPGRIAFRCATGIASGTMLDGKYDAARLPEIPGRALLRVGGMMAEIQTPFISDMTIRETVNAAKKGDHATAPTRTVAPDVIFKYALEELSGDCSYRDLYKRFKTDGVTQKEVISILKDYEVRGTPPALEPEIEIDDELYYLAPAVTGSKRPRTLVRVIDFEREFDAKWDSILTLHASRIENSAETVPSEGAENPQTLEGELIIQEA